METKEVRNVVVVGAGVMGHSIAQVFAQAGIDVGLVDLDQKILDRAVKLIRNNLSTLARLGKIRNNEISATLDRIHPCTDLVSAAAGVDFALEAVIEVPAVKKSVFSELSELCPEHAVLASNTSTLDIFNILPLLSKITEFSGFGHRGIQ